MRFTKPLLLTALIASAIIITSFIKKEAASPKNILSVKSAKGVNSVSDVVTAALAFKAMLTTTQQATLEKTYTTTLARKWSNLPCGSGCRNGVQFSTLTSTQLAAAKAVIQAAMGTGANQGYDQFNQILLADDYLNANGGGSGYGSGIYFIAFLNTPTTTGTWMLQFGGHHFAFNIAFNKGLVVGTTPQMIGVEPKSFTVSGTTYAPLTPQHDAFTAMLASLSTTQLTTAKLSSTFSDCLLSPGESNGNSNVFPTTKQGLACSTLSTTQQNLVLAAVKKWVDNADNTTADSLMAIYTNEINSTYIAFTSSSYTAGNASTFLNTNTNYVRVDGPSVWIEFVCQNGVVFSSQIHYHSVWRDHLRDYGKDFANTALPLTLLTLDAKLADKKRTLVWKTAEEKNMSRFEIEYSTNASDGFVKVGTVAAINNSSTNAYSFVDNVSTPAIYSYYRLKIIGINGEARYSKIVSIKNTVTKNIVVYPNPATTQVTIGTLSQIENGTIKIVSNEGRVVFVKSAFTGNNLVVNTGNFAAGVYTVQVESNGEIKTAKFIKQ